MFHSVDGVDGAPHGFGFDSGAYCAPHGAMALTTLLVALDSMVPPHGFVFDGAPRRDGINSGPCDFVFNSTPRGFIFDGAPCGVMVLIEPLVA